MLKLTGPIVVNSNNLSGYLFKRSHHNTFKKWNRRWFTLSNSKLLYQKKIDSNVQHLESDLRLCKVREVNDNERRFTFEIVSPKCRHLLQADSQKECNLWVQSMNKAINEALNSLNTQKLNNENTICLNGNLANFMSVFDVNSLDSQDTDSSGDPSSTNETFNSNSLNSTNNNS